MNQYQHVEILLVEDSSADAEMTLRTLKKRGIANDIDWVKDGVEALEYLRCEGAWADRRNGLPRLVLLDLKMPRMPSSEALSQFGLAPLRNAAMSLPFCDHFACSASSLALSPDLAAATTAVACVMWLRSSEASLSPASLP